MIHGLPPHDPLLDALIAALEARESVALLTVTAASGENAHARGKRMLVWEDGRRASVGNLGVNPGLSAQLLAATANAFSAGRPAMVVLGPESSRVTSFIEVQTPPAHLIICGAGHIAVPLAAMAHLCDFEVSVIDDRALYASAERFPTADRVLAGDFRTELAGLRNGRAVFDRRTCAVLVTRGHQHDVECLVELLDDPLPYIGMIGSRRRVRAVFDLLRSDHHLARERFSNIYAPVGLDIGAHTPAEIAVAIMGEIINVLRGGPGLSLRTAQPNPPQNG
jgi:xanthine dehydrogenase accessory factor